MSESLKTIFDRHFQHVAFDKTFSERVTSFVRRFLAKNDDHVSFFGSGLIGVYPVRWNYSDTDEWWDEIFNVNDSLLQRDLFRHPEIKTNRVVSSDVLNHAMVYALHRVHTSSEYDKDEKHRETLKTLIMISLNVKFLSSLMAHYFRYPSDKGVAEKTFNNLSYKFDIKTYGSWGKLVKERSAAFISDKGRYYKSYTLYNDDIEIIKMINDAQGRIRETVKDITAEYYRALEAEAKVLSSSSNVEIDGTVTLKDLHRKRNEYIRYLKHTLVNQDGFVKEDLLAICYKAIPSLTPDFFEVLLKRFPEIYKEKKYAQLLNRFIDNLLVFSFDLLEKNEIKLTNLSSVIYRLKHVYMSGRVTDELLLKTRMDFDKIVQYTDKKMKGKPLVPERCGFFLYLILRTVTMNYYK